MAAPGMPSSFDDYSEYKAEGRWQKFTRKLKEEPLIPFGCALTCYALFRATRSMKSGDHNQTNRMFRARIYAQFFTILCIVGGSYYYAEEREKRKKFESAIAERETMTKREMWIKELEARDAEEREIKAAKDRSILRPQGPVSTAIEEVEKKKNSVVESVKELGGFR